MDYKGHINRKVIHFPLYVVISFSGKIPVMKPLKKIKSGFINRNLSIAKMAIKSGKNLWNSRSDDIQGLLGDAFEGQIQTIVKELGVMKGSFMKAGQLLSLYSSSFLPEAAQELLKALENQSYFLEWDTIKDQIPQELLEKIDIDTHPLAAASLGQVHKGVVRATGEEVAIKIQYKGVADAIDNDIKALKMLLSMMKLLPKGKSLDPVFEEVKVMLRRETQYLKELEATDRYSELVKDYQDIHIPKTYGEFSSDKIIVTEFMDGYGLRDDYVMELSQEERNHLGEILLESFFQEIFFWGVAQTDAHFGNYLIRENNGKAQWVFLDFGAHKYIPEDFQKGYQNLIKSCARLDRELYFETVEHLGYVEPGNASFHDLLWDYCKLLGSPFQGGEYDWGKSIIPEETMKMVPELMKNVSIHKPPGDSVFLDRKIGGVFYILKHLKSKFDPLITLNRVLEKEDTSL